MTIVSLLANVAACSWEGTQQFLPTADVTACLKAIPFNPDWRDGTVDSIRKVLPHYVLRDSLTDTGPPANIQVDLAAELDQIATTEYANDMDMQSALSKLFSGDHDAHTSYAKCKAYINIDYSQPFNLRVAAVGEAQKIYLDGERKPGLLDHLGQGGQGFAEYDGFEVVAIDGVAPITAITHFADTFIGQSQDQGTRFNIAVFRGYFTKRFMYYHDLPEGEVEYELRDVSNPSAEPVTVSMPWTAVPHNPKKIVDITAAACAVQPVTSNSGVLRGPAYSYSSDQVEDEPPQAPLQSTPTNWSAVDSLATVDSRNDPMLSLYVNQDGKTAVWKVASFSPKNYTETCNVMQRTYSWLAEHNVQNLIIDVQQNGGGAVCLGYNFVRMLVPDLIDAPPSVYEMAYDLPWSAAISDAVLESQDARDALGMSDYIDASTGKHILPNETSTFYNGGPTYLRGRIQAQRTPKFYLDCDDKSDPDYTCDLSTPAMTFPKDRILVISDGYCGSTCATFMHRMQAGSYATVAGIGGIKHMPMSSSSFAGGFVGTVDEVNSILNNTASSGEMIQPYPMNGGVTRFARGEVYGYGRTKTPAQYAWARPDMRLNFWDFNGDLGPLYDMAETHFSASASVPRRCVSLVVLVVSLLKLNTLTNF